MADITCGGSGLASSTTPNAPWPGGTLPAATDNVIVPSGVTLTVDGTQQYANLTLTNGGRMIVAEDASLTVNNLYVRQLTRVRLDPGSTVNLSCPLSGDTASLAIGEINTASHLQFAGSAAKPATIRRAPGSLGVAAITAVGYAPSSMFGSHIQFFDLGSESAFGIQIKTTIGGMAAETGFDAAPGGIVLSNFLYECIGGIEISASNSATLVHLTDGRVHAKSTTRNSLLIYHATDQQLLRVSFPSVKDGVDSRGTPQFYRRNFSAVDCVFEKDVKFTLDAGVNTPDWTLFEGNVLILDQTDWTTGHGNTYKECLIAYKSTRGSPHGWAPAGYYNTVYDRCVFTGEDINLSGDSAYMWALPTLYGYGGPVLTRTVTINNCISLPIRNGPAAGRSPGIVVAGLGAEGQTTTVRHCTFLGRDASARMGETYGPWKDMVAAYRDNIIANFSGSDVNARALRMSTAAPSFEDAYTPSGVHHNGLYGLQASPYSFVASGSVGANDVIADPQLVREDTGPCAWDLSLGGPGTTASAMERLRNNPTLWRSSLLPYIREGVRPTNPAYQAASDTDTYAQGWIGAVEGVASYRPKIQTQQRLLMGVGL